MALGKKTGGRVKGSRNKAIIERELKAERDAMAAAALEDPEVQQALAAIPAAEGTGKRLGKQILDDFANVLAGMAAAYQPMPPGMENMPLPPGRKPDPDKFLKYATLAIYSAEKVAQFQSPKLSAVMVGAAQAKRIRVEGGLPDLDQAPQTIEHEAPAPEPTLAPPVAAK